MSRSGPAVLEALGNGGASVTAVADLRRDLDYPGRCGTALLGASAVRAAVPHHLWTNAGGVLLPPFVVAALPLALRIGRCPSAGPVGEAQHQSQRRFGT